MIVIEHFLFTSANVRTNNRVNDKESFRHMHLDNPILNQPKPEELNTLLTEVRACQVCAESLPLGPRPVVQANSNARIVLIGHAPGSRVHESGIPWDDPSGIRLRAWMGVGDATFYDETKIVTMPMGFCYPGKGKSGDNPPRPECAPLWHHRLLAHLPQRQLTVLIGDHAQKYYLGRKIKTLTERVKSWKNYAPDLLPIPHPSPRNQLWMKKNPWFEERVLPDFRQRVYEILETDNQ